MSPVLMVGLLRILLGKVRKPNSNQHSRLVLGLETSPGESSEDTVLRGFGVVDLAADPMCGEVEGQEVDGAPGRKPVRNPLLPSPGEMAACRVDHFPYRPRCKH